MNNAHMPKFIKPSQMADKSSCLTGKIALAEFVRLTALIGHQSDVLVIKVNFGYDEHGRCLMQGDLKTSFELTCQRCMESFTLKVSSGFKVVPVSDEVEGAALENETEYVLMQDGRVPLYELIEEELILNLPIIAKHDDSHVGCIPHKMQFGISSLAEVEEEEVHPFKVLEALKDK